MNSRAATVILVLVILLLLAGAYSFMRGPDQTVTALSTVAPADQAEQQFIQLAGELNPISFDTTLFQDPNFASLVDIGTQVVPEPAGRADPFGAVGGTAAR